MLGLLTWFESRRVAYPWRLRDDPYAVLVSEVMLQQTQAARVAPAFDRFMEAFPTIQDLAAAPVAEVIRAWSGLGYNRRAVALSKAARAIVMDHGGTVPGDPEALASLPGVGPYTAAAVASLAYQVPIASVDTNVRRVVARSLMGAEPHEVRTADIRRAADRAIDRVDPGGWNQAVMDLGREVCRPVPRCAVCPLASRCRFRRQGNGRPVRPRTTSSYEGSTRQLRGRVVLTLTDGSTTLGRLAAVVGRSTDLLVPVIELLARDGLVRASPAARAGSPRGRISLAEDRSGTSADHNVRRLPHRS
jgi:A/G-specific adenine glycosylase